MNDTSRLPPPPFWRTRYFALDVMARPDRRSIDMLDILRALQEPSRRERQDDGRVRLWYYAATQGRWMRVVTEADGETVHNVFWDRDFRP